MHIIEHYFDACGFDLRFVQGGTSNYLWNLSRTFAERGHRVSLVTPAHGQLDRIRELYPVVDLPFCDEYELTFPVDPVAWHGFPDGLHWKLRTTAHRVTIDGVDIYLLSNEVLDQLPDTFYPPYESKGSDPVFFKPLVFQVDSIRLIRRFFADEQAVVHAHEPYYHYLLPAAFKNDPTKSVVSTVQSNMPITKMVYRPKIEALLQFLEVAVDLPPRQTPITDPLDITMSQYQSLTHLHYEYPPDYVEVYALVAEHADLVGFLSRGQLEYYATFADTPFERLFTRLPIAKTVDRTAHKFFVAGCAIGDSWLAVDRSRVDRDAVLRGLGVDPALPTFFHNARLALHHKGQLELMRAVDRVLAEGLNANFVIRCLSTSGGDDAFFREVAERHSDRVHIEFHRVPEEQIIAYAASSDFCVFPSKFEMDTFLIAQGEAMACGAVPIATAQSGMAHYGHVADPVNGSGRQLATGFAVNRSFAEDDPALADALADRFRRAVELLVHRPAEYERLASNAIATARRFSWSHCADLHLAAFQRLAAGWPAQVSDDDALARGWFHRLTAAAWRDRPADIAGRAAELADLDAYQRVAELSPHAASRVFVVAYARADFATCERLAPLLPDSEPWAAVRDRSDVRVLRGRRAWTLRYRLPHAERVALVRATPTALGRGRPTVTELVREAGWFTATISGEPPKGPLHLALTLESGRMTFDSIPGLG